MKLPVLPVYYYRDHFLEMLAFVGDIYGSILTDEHRAFMARFDGLSREAQCLLIRMVNRRGPVFSRAALRYAEISDSDQALDELTACGHLARADEHDYESRS